ncbi:MAG: hypothetical protein RLZ35_1122 [Pseudomonadota bacterium]|jgi:hypothetical protein
MFKHKQLRQVVIQPALHLLDAYSVDAEELLIATCAIESDGGTYLVQTGLGSAKGIFQMEPITHDDLWSRFLKNNPLLKNRLLITCGYQSPPRAETLVTNLLYASMMAYVLYMSRSPHHFPAQNDINAVWIHYKKYWNTYLGKTTKEKFLNAYYHFVGGHVS